MSWISSNENLRASLQQRRTAALIIDDLKDNPRWFHPDTSKKGNLHRAFCAPMQGSMFDRTTPNGDVQTIPTARSVRLGGSSERSVEWRS